MDIIITTPKREMANAAREAADCIADGGGEYFRQFRYGSSPTKLKLDQRVWYVEDGYLRGFCTTIRVEHKPVWTTCQTTGRSWAPGLYVIMDATSWRWIKPIRMRGFQGFRYLQALTPTIGGCAVEIVGGWRDPKPPTPGS